MPQYVYCLACAAGSEAALARELAKAIAEAKTLYPTLEREEKRKGKWTRRTLPLVPGYLFVYAENPLPPELFFRFRRVRRLLGYNRTDAEAGAHKSYALEGADLEFALWVYENGGHIGVSHAALLGGKVEIVEGPLRYYEGRIKKLDKHIRKALVAVSVDGAEKDVWLSFSWVETKAE